LAESIDLFRRHAGCSSLSRIALEGSSMKTFKTTSFVGVGLVFLMACGGAESEREASTDSAMTSAPPATPSDAGSTTDSGNIPDGGSIPDSAPDASACSEPTHFARGTVVNASLLDALAVRLADTGASFAPLGDDRSAMLLTVNLPPLLSAGVATANAAGANGEASANASLANASLDLGALNLPTNAVDNLLDRVIGTPLLGELLGALSVRADVIQTAVQASCGGASGTTTLVNLRVNDTPINLTGVRNQIVDLTVANLPELGIRLIIDEQLPTPNGLTVNAVHVKVSLGTSSIADVVLAGSTASVDCTCN
jgi:hypothetical protein